MGDTKERRKRPYATPQCQPFPKGASQRGCGPDCCSKKFVYVPKSCHHILTDLPHCPDGHNLTIHKFLSMHVHTTAPPATTRLPTDIHTESSAYRAYSVPRQLGRLSFLLRSCAPRLCARPGALASVLRVYERPASRHVAITNSDACQTVVRGSQNAPNHPSRLSAPQFPESCLKCLVS